MTADASFDSRTGALKITGSNAVDNVQVNVTTPNQVDVWVNQRLLRLKPNAIRSIQVEHAVGNDYFQINAVAQNSLNVRSIDVKLGSGVNEKVAITLGSAGRICVDAVASRATSVSLNTVVTDRFFVDLGSNSEVSADTIQLIAADINRFDARMGGGDDRLEALSSSVRRAMSLWALVTTSSLPQGPRVTLIRVPLTVVADKTRLIRSSRIVVEGLKECGSGRCHIYGGTTHRLSILTCNKFTRDWN